MMKGVPLLGRRISLGFIVGGAMLIVFGVAPAFGQSVARTAPADGACLKGGSTTTVVWTKSSDVDHVGLYYSSAGTYPGYGQWFAHPVFGTSRPWTVPNDTTSGAKVIVEGHTPAHVAIATDNGSAFSIDSSPPATPSVPSKTSSTQISITLSWNTVSDSGCAGVKGYTLFRNGSVIGNIISQTSFIDRGLLCGTTYSYRVAAVDNQDHESAQGAAVSLSTNSCPGTPPPTSPSTPTPTPPPISPLTQPPVTEPVGEPTPPPTEPLGTVPVTQTISLPPQALGLPIAPLVAGGVIVVVLAIGFALKFFMKRKI